MENSPGHLHYLRSREGQRRHVKRQKRVDHNRAAQKYFGSSSSVLGRLSLVTTLQGHTGCVNTVVWNSRGDKLVSGSDDRTVKIWDVHHHRLLYSYQSGHSANIFCAKFLPFTGDEQIISCAGDCQVRYNNITTHRNENSKELYKENNLKTFYCHDDRVKKLCTEPGSPFVFLSCSEDGTIRRLDLRMSHSCTDATHCERSVEIDLRRGDCCSNRQGRKIRVNSIAINNDNGHYLVVGGSDPICRLYDRRMISSNRSSSPNRATVAWFRPERFEQSDQQGGHITGVAFSTDGSEVVATYGGDYVYLWEVERSHTTYEEGSTRFVSPTAKRKYSEAKTEDETEEYGMDVVAESNKEAKDKEKEEEEDYETELDERQIKWQSTKERMRLLQESQDRDAERIEDEVEKEAEEEESDEDEHEQEQEQATTLDSDPAKFYVKKVYRQVFKGHLNVQTVKEVSFLGPNSEFIASGSDDGRIFVWEKRTAKIVKVLEGDNHVVNCVRGHPNGDPVIASSGIDDNIKIWMPISESITGMEDLEEIVQRNERALEEGPQPMHLSRAVIMNLLRMMREDGENGEGGGGNEEERVACLQS
ncbi:DDB1- and CUL4-associated factor 6 [Balamuthia mandrillaris]